MDKVGRAALEESIRAACGEQKHDVGVGLAVRGYGPEILGFLIAIHPNEDDASDAFSEVTEALWRGLPTFEWRSSFRTWAYSVARNIVRTRRRDGGRRRRRMKEVGDSALALLTEKVRTETLSFLRTPKRTQLQKLRESLDQEDQILLVLRVDRGLSWNDLVGVLYDGNELLAADVAREAARLRKRFQTVKERLRELARQEGLVV